MAIGTETDGSIVCPAGANGVVGHKPTLGLVSRGGIVPISAEQDTAGPMARHVVDAALTLAVLQGADPDDPATGAIPPDQPTEYALDRRRARGRPHRRVAVRHRLARDRRHHRTGRGRPRGRRRHAPSTSSCPTIDIVDENEFPALLAEFKRDINAYLAETPGRHPADLAGLIAFNEADPVELEFFGQEIFELAQAAPSTDDPAYLAQRAAATGAARAGDRRDAGRPTTSTRSWRPPTARRG